MMILAAGQHSFISSQDMINLILALVAVATLVWTVLKDRNSAKEEDRRNDTDYAELSLEGLKSLVDQLRIELERSRGAAVEIDRKYADRQKILVKEIVRLREEVTLLRIILDENGVTAPPPSPSLVPHKLLGEL